MSETHFVWKHTNLLFSGSPKDVAAWMKENLHPDILNVEVEIEGGVLIPSKIYLEGVKVAEEAKIHARNTMVHQLVISAMQKQDRARFHDETDGMDIVAQDTAIAIIKLFEKED